MLECAKPSQMFWDDKSCRAITFRMILVTKETPESDACKPIKLYCFKFVNRPYPPLLLSSNFTPKIQLYVGLRKLV